MAEKTPWPPQSMPRPPRRLPVGTGPGHERATDAWREVRPSLGRFIADVHWSGVAMLVWGRIMPTDHRGTVQIADDGVGHDRFPDVRPVLPR